MEKRAKYLQMLKKNTIITIIINRLTTYVARQLLNASTKKYLSHRFSFSLILFLVKKASNLAKTYIEIYILRSSRFQNILLFSVAIFQSIGERMNKASSILIRYFNQYKQKKYAHTSVTKLVYCSAYIILRLSINLSKGCNTFP